ncbi:hypothetical protein, partial [Pseudoxanthomonas japonensis]|uniref:hypothetical protein n=1 Tax=Pseudoxanthomonas japonensis TaxID=69284 RepID=UPI001BCCF0FC
GLLEHRDYLAVGEAGLLHGTSSGKRTRKFHFWRQLMGGGITVRWQAIVAGLYPTSEDVDCLSQLCMAGPARVL